MKPTPRLKNHPSVNKSQVSWLLADVNYTHVHFHDGGYYLSAITLGKLCQRFPYLIRLSKQLAVAPGLIVGWHRTDARLLVVELEGCGRLPMVVVPRRRIGAVSQLLRGLGLV